MATRRTPNREAVSLRSAYKDLLAREDLLRKLGMARQTILNRRVRLGKGEYPEVESMRNWLRKVGWVMVAEEQWAPKRKAAAVKPKRREG
ncbi:MAG: hypothetical protein ABI432_16620 [Flavobacteriales bacterium]